MVNYNCIRCDYTTKDKTKMNVHFSRKTLCKPLLNDINIDDYKNDILNGKIINLKNMINPGKSSVNLGKSSVNLGKSSVNLGKSSVNPGKSDDFSSDVSEDSIEIPINNKKELICQYCKKIFRRNDYLESHLKKSCKMLKEFNNIYNFDKSTFGKKIYNGYKNAGDIYILQTDYINDNNYKIGITNNIQRRLCSYRCSNTYEPRLYYYISCQDIKVIDNILKVELVKNNVKKEIFQGDVEDLKNSIIKVIKKQFKVNKVYVHEPEIKIGDLSECRYCNKCFYTKKDLFEHFNCCEEYKESLAKKSDIYCQYCEKQFSFNQSLYRHYKTCKKKKKDDEEKANLLNLVNKLNEQLKEQKEQLKTRDKQLEKKDEQIDELIKKAGITQNIQQNIKILAYKNTDISHLTDMRRAA